MSLYTKHEANQLRVLLLTRGEAPLRPLALYENSIEPNSQRPRLPGLGMSSGKRHAVLHGTSLQSVLAGKGIPAPVIAFRGWLLVVVGLLTS